MDPIHRLTEIFERFPGIGPRQAGRFVQYLLVQPPSVRAELANQVQSLGANTRQCASCFRWFARKHQETLCTICANPERLPATLFVVEKESDIVPIEKAGYKGKYFVLGGTIPLAAEEPERHVRMRELLGRVEEDASQKVLSEVILGLSATTEGDHTRLILMERLRPIAEGLELQVTTLGRGLSTGSELEYVDPDTLKAALATRQ